MTFQLPNDSVDRQETTDVQERTEVVDGQQVTIKTTTTKTVLTTKTYARKLLMGDGMVAKLDRVEIKDLTPYIPVVGDFGSVSVLFKLLGFVVVKVRILTLMTTGVLSATPTPSADHYAGSFLIQPFQHESQESPGKYCILKNEESGHRLNLFPAPADFEFGDVGRIAITVNSLPQVFETVKSHLTEWVDPDFPEIKNMHWGGLEWTVREPVHGLRVHFREAFTA
ncbi:hypothetical protein BC830DRAFT_1168285 [Chytriomyces sp. MP71]|nr:hypothetical protein BC830DRAFT_1168285 [Chytriomyces sp. MP71]